MKALMRVCTIILLSNFLGGCAYFRIPYDTEKPVLSLVDVKLKKANLLNQTFVAELTIENPNDFNLPIDGVDIKLELEGTTLGEGTTQQNFIVPAGGEANFKMKIRTNLFSNLGAIKKIIDEKPKTINYRLSGSVDVGLSLLFFPDYEFDKSDSVATPNLRKKQ